VDFDYQHILLVLNEVENTINEKVGFQKIHQFTRNYETTFCTLILLFVLILYYCAFCDKRAQQELKQWKFLSSPCS